MSEARGLPPRPVVPAALWALVASLAAARAALWWAPEWAPLAACGACGALAAALAGAACSRLGSGGAFGLACAVLACACLACVASALELRSQAALASALGSSPVSSWELLVASDPSQGERGWRARATASLPDGGPSGEVWLVSDDRLARGTRLRCVGRFAPSDGLTQWGRSSRAQGVAGTVRVLSVIGSGSQGGLTGALLGLREGVRDSLAPSSSDGRALLAGSVCGDSEALAARGLDDLLSRCGVSHLAAVSGGHLVLVCALAERALSRLRVRGGARVALLLLATGAFVAFCGAPVSAVRSWAMSVVAGASSLAGRRSHPLSSASVVALLMLLADPGVTGQLSFLLSVTCVCAICLFGAWARFAVEATSPSLSLARALGPRAGRALGRLGRACGEALALTLVSQLATLPLTCASFGQLCLVAPLANVLVAPLFTAVLSLGLACGLLAWAPPLQAPLLALADLAGCAFLGVLRPLAELPLAVVATDVGEVPAFHATAALAAALWLAWPRPSRRAVLGAGGALCALGLAWVLWWRALAPARVCVLDVGQGDAILVTDGSACVLVDTGPGDAVVSALARNNVFWVDAVVLTHLHADHAGGLDELLSAVGVGEVMVPEGADAGRLAQGREVSELSYGDVVRAGRFSLEVVSPTEPAGGEGNEGSLVMRLSFSDGSRTLEGLLTADAERDEVGACVRRGDVGDVDLLKVGHHGSAASVDDGLAQALAPEVSVASAGEGNEYGHPTEECVSTLEAAGSLFLCTADAGDVTVEPGEGCVVVTCQRGDAGEVL